MNIQNSTINERIDTMKKFLSLLLAVIMLLGCIPAMAEEFPKLDNSAAWD